MIATQEAKETVNEDTVHATSTAVKKSLAEGNFSGLKDELLTVLCQESREGREK